MKLNRVAPLSGLRRNSCALRFPKLISLFFRTNTGSTPSKKSGKKCWIKGDAFSKTSSYYFSKKSGYTLDGVQTKKYTSVSAAKKGKYCIFSINTLYHTSDNSYNLRLFWVFRTDWFDYYTRIVSVWVYVCVCVCVFNYYTRIHNPIYSQPVLRARLVPVLSKLAARSTTSLPVRQWIIFHFSTFQKCKSGETICLRLDTSLNIEWFSFGKTLP